MNWQRGSKINPSTLLGLKTRARLRVDTESGAIFPCPKGQGLSAAECIKFNEPLKNKTTFKIGGRAKFFCQPKNIADLRSAVNAAKKHKIPIFILGAGSNVLISDKGLIALVIKLGAPYFAGASFDNSSIIAGSSLSLAKLLRETEKFGLSGVEFLAGIPGTVGGALAMNAGAWGRNIGDLVEEAKVMDYNGNIKTLRNNKIKFKYRNSSLAKYIILSARLKLKKKKRETIRENISQNIRRRRDSQDARYPNAGCIFKNPKKDSAGRLIDLCGLKGKRVGDAFISDRHANFIMNRGNAKTADVLRLMDLVRKKVKNKFRITLKPEIKIWQ